MADARKVVREALGMHAELLEGRLVIGPCRASCVVTVCHARIVAHSPQRYRVTVRDDGDSWDVRARELPS